MPNPTQGESESEFVSRFMESPEARADYPDQKQRAAVAYSKFRERQNAACAICAQEFKDWTLYRDHMQEAHKQDLMKVANTGQVGRKMRVRFIEPGPANYADIGTVLISKEALDKFAHTIEGRPIFNEVHKEVSNDDFSSGRADGIMGGNVRFEQDGWFWADAYVWDPATIQNIVQNGYKVSCAYDVKRWSDAGGTYHNIPYNREVLDGEYTHMAIVNNPRYERATIVYNDKGGAMKLKWFTRSKDKPEEQVASEVELTNAVVPLDGKEVPLEDVIKGFTAQAKRQELANAKLGDEDLIQVGDAKIAVKDLKAGYLASLKNAEDDEKKKKEDEERQNAEEEEKKKKEEEERKNAEEEEKKKKEEKERENAKHFEDLQKLANSRPGKFEPPKILTLQDKEQEGYKRYGPIQTH